MREGEIKDISRIYDLAMSTRLCLWSRNVGDMIAFGLSLIHISEPTRLSLVSRMPSSA